MTTVTTDLLNARLKTVETRMDARILAIEAAIAGLIESQRQLRADIKSLRVTVVVTAIASVLAIGAINATVFSNMLAAFKSGADVGAFQTELLKTQAELTEAQVEVKRQVEATAALLKKMEARERQQAEAVNSRRN